MRLTFGAVIVVKVLLPAGQTLLESAAVAGVVSVLVVSRPAQGVAVLAVVVGRADHPVLVVQALPTQVLDVGAAHPVGSGFQALQLRHSGDQNFWKKIRNMVNELRGNGKQLFCMRGVVLKIEIKLSRGFSPIKTQ